MQLSRRTFLGATGLATAAPLLSSCGFSTGGSEASTDAITFTGQRLPLMPPLTDDDRKRLAKTTVVGGATLLRSGSFRRAFTGQRRKRSDSASSERASSSGHASPYPSGSQASSRESLTAGATSPSSGLATLFGTGGAVPLEGSLRRSRTSAGNARSRAFNFLRNNSMGEMLPPSPIGAAASTTPAAETTSSPHSPTGGLSDMQLPALRSEQDRIRRQSAPEFAAATLANNTNGSSNGNGKSSRRLSMRFLHSNGALWRSTSSGSQDSQDSWVKILNTAGQPVYENVDSVKVDPIDRRTVYVALGAGGVLDPTSKNVYDSVMVVTSFDSLGSITKATGHCLFSPGSSTYWLKQKHSSLLKCAAAWRGGMVTVTASGWASPRAGINANSAAPAIDSAPVKLSAALARRFIG